MGGGEEEAQLLQGRMDMVAPEDSPDCATGLMGWVPAARMHVDQGVGNEPLGVDQIGGLQTRKAFVCLSVGLLRICSLILLLELSIYTSTH